MLSTDWYRLIPMKYNLDKLIVWARKAQLSRPHTSQYQRLQAAHLSEEQAKLVHPEPEVVAPSQKNCRLWVDVAPEEFWQEINEIFPCIEYYGNARSPQIGPRSTIIWEETDTQKLVDHIDFSTSPQGNWYPGLSNIIVPLIGRFETWYYTDETCTQIADSVIYEPGNIFVIKNWDRWHAGQTLDDYRLCLQIFTEPSTPEEYVEKVFK